MVGSFVRTRSGIKPVSAIDKTERVPVTFNNTVFATMKHFLRRRPCPLYYCALGRDVVGLADTAHAADVILRLGLSSSLNTYPYNLSTARFRDTVVKRFKGRSTFSPHSPDYALSFGAACTIQPRGWTKPQQGIAKVEWHLGELYTRVSFVVTNMSRPAERFIARRFCGSSWKCGCNRHQCRRETFNKHAFKSNRRDKCVRMPEKMARLDPRTPLGRPDNLGTTHTLHLGFQLVQKMPMIHIIRGYLGFDRLYDDNGYEHFKLTR